MDRDSETVAMKVGIRYEVCYDLLAKSIPTENGRVRRPESPPVPLL